MPVLMGLELNSQETCNDSALTPRIYILASDKGSDVWMILHNIFWCVM